MPREESRDGQEPSAVSPRCQQCPVHVSVLVLTQNEEKGKQKIVRDISGYFSTPFFHCIKRSIKVKVHGLVINHLSW